MLTIDRAWTARVRAHDQLALRYRRLLPDGTASPLEGEVWAFVIEGAAEPLVVTGAAGADLEGTYTEMAFGPEAGPALAGKSGLRWSLAEVLPGGVLDTRHSGQLVVEPAPAIAAVPPVFGDAPVAMIIEQGRA